MRFCTVKYGNMNIIDGDLEYVGVPRVPLAPEFRNYYLVQYGNILAWGV